uniref:Uncharacterized protein n=1 Tax=Arundo donax TaxID=35708 RepID=A0A0A9BRD0_ARUDO
MCESKKFQLSFKERMDVLCQIICASREYFGNVTKHWVRITQLHARPKAN